MGRREAQVDPCSGPPAMVLLGRRQECTNMKALGGLLLLASFLLPLEAAQKPFDAGALLRLARISDPQLSPDGKTVAFVAQTPDLEANTRPTRIYVVPLAGGPSQTVAAEGSQNERPRWSPDSRHIAFISNRSGSSQVWIMD